MKKCPICGSPCANDYTLKVHMRARHLSEFDDRVPCDICKSPIEITDNFCGICGTANSKRLQ